MAARLRDFPVLLAATQQCVAHWKPSRMVVAVPSHDQKVVQAGLGAGVEVIDENSLLQDFDREAYQKRPIPLFPPSFGWYFQQFLKIEYCRQTSAKNCLVWDADTVPLRTLDFFDDTGRIYLTKAEEFHRPYFHTFRELFGFSAPSAKSFISQHMFVECGSMRSMCSLIEERHKVSHWTNALGTILEGHPERANLFSEYETYANYMLLYEAEKVVTRNLSWERGESNRTWAVPSRQLTFAKRAGLDFVAYESKDAFCSRLLLKSLEKAPRAIKMLAITFVLRRFSGGF